MNRLAIAIALTLVAAAPAAAEPYRSKSRFGLGLELGAPSGLAGKYFLGGRQLAIQGGIGVLETWGDDGWHVHAEAVWHPVVLHKGRSATIPLHVGIGGRMLQHDGGFDRDICFNGRVNVECDDTHLGIRAPLGISVLFKEAPMDLFFELAFVVDLIHANNDYMHDHDDVDLHGALGGRFYF